MKYLYYNITEIPKLQKLYLKDNEISDIGGKILANVNKCKKLQRVWIDDNKISKYDVFKRRIKEKHPNKCIFIL